MTRKDYELIATPIRLIVEEQYAVRAELDRQNGMGKSIDRTENEAVISAMATLVGGLKYQLSKDNAKFDEDKFQKACGFTY